MKFEELKSLDLRKSTTVGEIVAAMRYCAFGARMLGEVAHTIFQMAGAKAKPIVIYDGLEDSPLGRLLRQFVRNGWAAKIIVPADYAAQKTRGENAIVVGAFSERHAAAIYARPKRALFINPFDMARPGQIRDGYFPDAVFADPRYIMPVIYAALEEWLEGKRAPVSALVSELRLYGGVASQVTRAAQALQAMTDDRDCLKFLTVSGAMTVAKMDLVISDMIELGMIDAISSTGALMAHGLVSSIGLKHYKYDPKYNDTMLARLKLNRVTDTLEPESNLDSVEQVIGRVIEKLDGARPLSPTILNRLIGEHLAKNYPGERGILKSAYAHGVPVFVPAFVDSELGNDLYIHNLKRRRRGKKPILMDLEIDSKELIKLVTGAKRFGIFSIGGGVPRNNVQNVAPLVEIINERLGPTFPERRFSYGVRICPDKPYFGHLSGCTYSENESWRKAAKDGIYAEVQADATQVWPFLVRYLMDARERRKAKGAGRRIRARGG
ncbi:MAG TPA: deoxyhypusine synthase family protein [Candidatus Acidoferrales bacterium]|nr:deoxyhypusine synthase family protein [Candidatus Acidoferrales bacterium]